MWIALVLALAWSAAPTVNDLTFLTRDGCVNTPDMVNNLDDALAALKLTNDYQFVNIGKLPKLLQLAGLDFDAVPAITVHRACVPRELGLKGEHVHP